MPHLEIPLVTALHFLVASAIGLVAAGASALAQPNAKPSSLVLVKVGIVILLLSWFIIAMVAMISFLDGHDQHKNNQRGAAKTKQYSNGTKVSASAIFFRNLLVLKRKVKRWSRRQE